MQSEDAGSAAFAGLAPRRPLAITIIACLQFLEAAALLATAFGLAVYPGYNAFAPIGMNSVADFLTDGGLGVSPVVLVLLLLAGGLTGALGVGLWALNERARKLLLGEAAGVVILLYRALMLIRRFASSLHLSDQTISCVYILITVNAIIFGYLFIHEGEFTKKVRVPPSGIL